MVVIVLGAVVCWAAWRGVHPEPGWFEVDEAFLTKTSVRPEVYECPLKRWRQLGNRQALCRLPHAHWGFPLRAFRLTVGGLPLDGTRALAVRLA